MPTYPRLAGTIGGYPPPAGSATLFRMDERHPSRSSLAPGGYGQAGGYEQPGYGAAAFAQAGYPPAGGYGEPGYGVPGYPPGAYPPGYNPWLGTFAGPRYASVWLRIAAYIIDSLVLGVVNTAAYLAVITMTATTSATGSPTVPLTAVLAAIVLVLVLDGIYFVAQEGSSGQTLGKRAVGTKVVKADGSEMSVDAALVRFLFLLLAGLGVGGLVTVLMVALSDTKQRLGDRVAGTIVVKAS